MPTPAAMFRRNSNGTMCRAANGMAKRSRNSLGEPCGCCPCENNLAAILDNITVPNDPEIYGSDVVGAIEDGRAVLQKFTATNIDRPCVWRIFVNGYAPAKVVLNYDDYPEGIALCSRYLEFVVFKYYESGIPHFRAVMTLGGDSTFLDRKIFDCIFDWDGTTPKTITNQIEGSTGTITLSCTDDGKFMPGGTVEDECTAPPYYVRVAIAHRICRDDGTTICRRYGGGGGSSYTWVFPSEVSAMAQFPQLNIGWFLAYDIGYAQRFENYKGSTDPAFYEDALDPDADYEHLWIDTESEEWTGCNPADNPGFAPLDEWPALELFGTISGCEGSSSSDPGSSDDSSDSSDDSSDDSSGSTGSSDSSDASGSSAASSDDSSDSTASSDSDSGSDSSGGGPGSGSSGGSSEACEPCGPVEISPSSTVTLAWSGVIWAGGGPASGSANIPFTSISGGAATWSSGGTSAIFNCSTGLWSVNTPLTGFSPFVLQANGTGTVTGAAIDLTAAPSIYDPGPDETFPADSGTLTVTVGGNDCPGGGSSAGGSAGSGGSSSDGDFMPDPPTPPTPTACNTPVQCGARTYSNPLQIQFDFQFSPEFDGMFPDAAYFQNQYMNMGAYGAVVAQAFKSTNVYGVGQMAITKFCTAPAKWKLDWSLDGWNGTVEVDDFSGQEKQYIVPVTINGIDGFVSVWIALYEPCASYDCTYLLGLEIGQSRNVTDCVVQLCFGVQISGESGEFEYDGKCYHFTLMAAGGTGPSVENPCSIYNVERIPC